MAKALDRGTGVGLVFANMVGAGVLLSAGFMAQDLDAGLILVSWVVGLAIALFGARAYAELAGISGKSGGEYRYLHDYMHPYAGYVAGWASLLVGFTAAVAIDAFAAGAFVARVFPGVDPRIFGTVLILALTVAHSVQLDVSRYIQNILVALKIGFVLAFALMGLVLGSMSWPEWVPANPSEGFPAKAFVLNQYWVAFAFSGWNAAIYAAGEFENPRRDVPFAVLTGCTVVGGLYLILNWVFVANLTPEAAAAVFQHDETRITLAHVVAQKLVGPTAGDLVSLIAALIMISATSAMLFVGPRVYAAMADDGLLPRVFRSREGRPPVGSVLLQSAIALVAMWAWTVVEVLQAASAVLMLSSALTATCVVLLAFRQKVRVIAVIAAVLYVVSTAMLLVAGSYDSVKVAGTLAFLLVIAGIGYAVAQWRGRRKSE